MLENLRNIAIIAHVDHGKTTLVDSLLRQSITNIKQDLLKGELIMDSNEIERERGITIFAKNASVVWNGVKINILDTPGHADFGGEVERVLTMADGALLVVDAKEGPMPQTRFVLKKALQLGLKIILVINKMDKPDARPDYVLDQVFNLFVELGATDEQADFPVVYAVAKLGKASNDMALESMKDIDPIFETIVKNIPPAKRDVDGPFQFLVVTISADNFKGRIATGKIYRGKVKSGDTVTHIRRDGSKTNFKITSLMTSSGLDKVDVEEGFAGDIVHIAGSPDVMIGETFADKDISDQLTPLKIDEPTIQVVFSVNSSPFAGREGTYVTSRQLRDRLYKEMETDVALRVKDTDSPESFLVAGRGELHLGILIERMRREGYEFQVAKPQVIYKEIDGQKMEPYEQVFIEVPETYTGIVIEKMGGRGADMKDMRSELGVSHFNFVIPTSRFFGYRNRFMTDTKGLGIMNTLFFDYLPAVEAAPMPHGSIIAYEDGQTTAFALDTAQQRGTLFLGPGVDVYRGQVVGQTSRDEDLEVNVCKMKQLTNMRSKSSDGITFLDPPRAMTVESSLEYLGDDELMEVTPLNIRIRKENVGKRKGK
jgi:GTP-binding protein